MTGIARKALASTLLLLLVGSPVLAGRSPASAATAAAGIQKIGMLPKSFGDFHGSIVGMDQGRRIAYYMFRDGSNFVLRAYDLDSKIPRLLREGVMGTYQELAINYYSPYTIQIDTKNQRMMILVIRTEGTSVNVIDLRTFDAVARWDLLPGFVGQGMTYSPKDDRLYLVGAQAGNAYGTVSFGAQKPAQPALVMALDLPEATSGMAQPAWVRPIPQCQQALDTVAVGAMIARSENLPALYFACLRANPYPGESGVVRLWIDPKADQQLALEQPLDFFPVSGSFTHQTQGIVGVAAFDPIRERFFVQSLSSGTPGTWVLDGRLAAWVGFIAAPNNNNNYLGVDPRSGHFYMGASVDGGYLVVSDISSTPISQGEVVPGAGVAGFISVDPKTHRVFYRADLAAMGLVKPTAGEHPYGVVVARDNTTIAEPARPVDYDSLTRDVPEGPKVITSFSGGVNGYGARLLLVGGYGGVLSATGQQIPLGSLRPGDRGLTMGRVTSLDLRPAGAAATAQAMVPDSNTDSEWHDTLGEDTEWPWGPATCLNGGGEAVTQQATSNGGDATVQCDLEKEQASASSSWGAASAGPIQVAASSFQTRTWRDAKDGVHTETVARTRGASIEIPGAGTLSFAEIWAKATTVAHGRPGTTKASYDRRVSGIVLTDADGEVTQRFGGCGATEDESCKQVIDELNRALSVKAHIALPDPTVIRSKAGAFAAVEQKDSDFYESRTMNNQGSAFAAEAASKAMPALQVVVYNDTEEKSRAVAQFAAIQANSIYTNTPVEDPPPAEPPAPIDEVTKPLSGGPVSPTSSAPVLDETAGDLGDTSIETAPIATDAVAAGPIETMTAFLVRSPGEALLVGSVWLTFLGSGVALYRRRAFLSLLQGGTS